MSTLDNAYKWDTESRQACGDPCDMPLDSPEPLAVQPKVPKTKRMDRPAKSEKKQEKQPEPPYPPPSYERRQERPAFGTRYTRKHNAHRYYDTLLRDTDG